MLTVKVNKSIGIHSFRYVNKYTYTSTYEHVNATKVRLDIFIQPKEYIYSIFAREKEKMKKDKEITKINKRKIEIIT